MAIHDRVADRIRELPDRPGIYVFKDAQGTPLYVGKAKSLRKRAANYLSGDQDGRLLAMLLEAHDLESVETDTESEALLLENNWIKQRQPRFNIRLRDDKTYPYLKLTLTDPYPRLAFTRRIVDDGAEYYGPFLPAGLARKAIKLVQKLFQIRVCDLEIDGRLPRPCLYFDMRRCLGPCVAGLTSAEEYAAAVERARLFLQGRNLDLLRELRARMLEASDRLEFERAAELRDTMLEVESIGERRKLSSQQGDDVDVYGVYVAGDNAAVTVFVMRGGQVLDRREFFWEGEPGLSESRLLSELLPQVYDRTTFIPKEIHLPITIEGEEALADWLSERKGERVYVRLPARGAKAERVALAMRNARMSYRRRFRGAAPHLEAVESLRRQLGLGELPSRIEGFDISTLQGTETVASLVVWEEGRLLKRDYRTFNIRGVEGPDDFEAMRQAVERAYRRRLEEVGAMPDLILIDGGRGQLNAALGALVRLGVEETPLAGLAKREEELFLPDRPEPLRLPRRDPGLQLLQRVRDEAHRFALSRHRRRRSKRVLRTRFDDLAGVGRMRRKLLVERFGSFVALRRASVEEISDVLGGRLGRSVFTQLRAGEGPGESAPSTVTEPPAAGEDVG
ncbi:MAG TPA: excinuclease ABC subunit UvrC [Thermoanaerobaculia bacterium]|nr:excinuclease ABC subunit UvrC [Thermoanaerobaculia bacterium]